MASSDVRVLVLADTHLGFDLPLKPRVNRRRRGHDFFANFRRALTPALQGEVDLVVHGGDLFFRSRVPDLLVELAMAPLLEVAERGIPVYLVPGNHERSRIPLQIWTVHPNLHIFHRPQTFICVLPQATIALSGFPFARRIRRTFPGLVEDTGFMEHKADIRLLCMHQAVEGARVGPADFTFRWGDDVVRGQDIDSVFKAVISGHIHRSQMLHQDLEKRPLPAPVIYPGSVERTAFAERFEPKHFVLLTIEHLASGIQPDLRVEFVPLPARPMVTIDIDAKSRDQLELLAGLEDRLLALDPNSIVAVRIRPGSAGANGQSITAAMLREIAPPTMNVSLRTFRRE